MTRTVIVPLSYTSRSKLPLSACSVTHSVQKSQEGDYHCKATVSTADEIEILASAVNTMLDKIDTLINKGLKSELAYKEMQLTALQSQINPHFLYNTLECINSLAQLGRRDDFFEIISTNSLNLL